MNSSTRIPDCFPILLLVPHLMRSVQNDRMERSESSASDKLQRLLLVKNELNQNLVLRKLRTNGNHSRSQGVSRPAFLNRNVKAEAVSSRDLLKPSGS